MEAEQEYTVHLVGKFHEAVDGAILGFLLDDARGITILGFNSYLLSKKIINARKGEVLEVVFTFKFPGCIRGYIL